MTVYGVIKGVSTSITPLESKKLLIFLYKADLVFNSWRSNERRGSRNQMGNETERSISRRRASENNANIMVSQSQREGQRAVVPMATARQNSAPSLGRNRQGSRRESCSIM